MRAFRFIDRDVRMVLPPRIVDNRPALRAELVAAVVAQAGRISLLTFTTPLGFLKSHHIYLYLMEAVDHLIVDSAADLSICQLSKNSRRVI